MEREAAPSRIALHVDTVDFDPAERLLAAAARDWIERYGGNPVHRRAGALDTQRQASHIAVRKLNAAEQIELRASSWQGIAHLVDGQIHAIVQQFDLGPGAISEAVSSAAAKAARVRAIFNA